jgi:hypothetical protein
LIEKGGKGDLVSNYYSREAARFSFEPIWLDGDWFPIPVKGD